MTENTRRRYGRRQGIHELITNTAPSHLVPTEATITMFRYLRTLYETPEQPTI
ncbi:hypothetical protein DAEQUDRAFT_729717 [Daedalea quercina L-15889]|uniref:Uncharacterized protein n=1 Tax=Daedalea quercina L-15889 TaxID=1314783 RepID=A0A165NG52_9APHY|nr:hypothetical protein DAEQUDRAFT_729717 [Daedalea quercina L-15889]